MLGRRPWRLQRFDVTMIVERHPLPRRLWGVVTSNSALVHPLCHDLAQQSVEVVRHDAGIVHHRQIEHPGLAVRANIVRDPEARAPRSTPICSPICFSTASNRLASFTSS